MLPRVHDADAVRRCRSILVLAVLGLSFAASPAFAATSTFSITGKGYGHGIGMSQYGAKGYADHGWGFAAIVGHYYRQTTLGTVSNPDGTVSNPDIWVNVDAKKANRASWVLHPAAPGLKLVVAGFPGPSTGALKFVASGSTVNVSQYVSGVWKLWKNFPSVVRVEQQGAVGTRRVQVTDASGPNGNTAVIYRGYMRLTAVSGKLKLVNAVPLEFYVYGVVPNESPSSWNIEALKAQAVVARSYAYATSYPSGVGSNPKELYCTTMSQMYRGFGSEAKTTNLAVDATRGKAVLYLKKPVQAFFFSSSGGFTADHDDIWGPTSAPYWSTVRTGVVDAYEAEAAGPGSLAVSWGSPILRTGDSLSSTFGYALPVVAVGAVYGTGGYAKQVRIRLADGTLRTVTGDGFRSKLGLRSCKFVIKNVTPKPGPVRYQESQSLIVFSAGWQAAKSSTLSGGGMLYSTTPAASAAIKFTGTQIALIGSRAASYGDMVVKLDGTPAQTVKLKSSTTVNGAKVWSASGLSNTTHSVTITVVGNGTVSFDAVDVTGSLTQAVAVGGPAAPRRFEEIAKELVFSGIWASASRPGLSGGAMRYASTAGAAVTFTMVGTDFSLISGMAPSNGSALVYVDGRLVGTAVMKATATSYQKQVFTQAGLSAGVGHIVRIQAVGNGRFAVDAVDVRGTLLKWTLAEETSPALIWSGTWLTQKSSRLSGGAMRYTTKKGAAVSATFSGVRVQLVSNRARSYGSVLVSVDGAAATKVSLHATPTSYRQVVWMSPLLKSGAHTVRIVAVGDGTAAVDRIDVAGSFNR